MTKEKITYSRGGDWEFPVIDLEQNNKCVSAIPILKRDKYEPILVGDNKDGIKVYHDNVLLEVAFNPFYSKHEMIERYRNVFLGVKKVLGDRYRIISKASHVYNDDELQHPKALEAGCSPNFNAYTVAPNPPVQFNGGLRSAGCHFHCGAKHLLDFDTRLNAIKLMDIFLGVPSIIFNPDKTEKQRRMLYGGPSEHRPTSFGLEYRPLSPGVIRSPETAELTYDLVTYSLSQLPKATKILESIDTNIVQKAIKDCDKKLARVVMNKVKLPKTLLNRIEGKYGNDLYKNWKI